MGRSRSACSPTQAVAAGKSPRQACKHRPLPPPPCTRRLQLGRLAELGLADLAWVRPAQLGPLLQALASECRGLRRLDLSSTGGLIDGVLTALQPQQQPGSQAGLPLLGELRLAHANRLTPAALRGLADSGLLNRLQVLDVSHVQCLGRGDSKSGGGSGSGNSGAPSEGSPAAQALPALLQAAGGSLRAAVLDGCWAGGGLLPLLARCCPGLERLSLVGCSGIGDGDLRALRALRSLADLAVGGASLAWHEHHALTGERQLGRVASGGSHQRAARLIVHAAWRSSGLLSTALRPAPLLLRPQG